jgi:two-component system, OmpR family, sensor histidine kinase MprB
MSLRRRMVLGTAAAAGFVVVLSAIACYLAVRSNMRGRLDEQLRNQAALVSHGPGSRFDRPRGNFHFTPRAKLPRPSLQNQGDIGLLSASGALSKRPDDPTRFSVTPFALSVARGTAKAGYYDATVGGTQVRVYVAPAGAGHAVIVEQALTSLNSTLHDLALILIAIAATGIAIALALGLLVARAAAAPVNALRRAAEHVESTGDLSRRIEVSGTDDLARLGHSFNDMLGALAESQRAQRQLVADASHELRTPVTTIRTNLEVFARNPDLAPEDREPLLQDLIGESAELGALVEDLLESARDEDSREAFEDIALDELVASELERWGRRHPAAKILAQLGPVTIHGRERRLQRALANLLDNAIKWSAADGTVEVTLEGGTLTVRDHGPGFQPEDLPFVFDRFYRAPSARTVPGSGLGLAIVKKVAQEHGGEARAENAPGGGASVSMTLLAATLSPGPERRERQPA